MPVLPSSPLPTPDFSPVALTGLILFVVVDLIGTAARLLSLHIGDKIAERLARVVDAEVFLFFLVSLLI